MERPEAYPMTFYPESLQKIKEIVESGSEEKEQHILEPLSVSIGSNGYLKGIKTTKLYLGILTIFLVLLLFISALTLSSPLLIFLLIPIVFTLFAAQIALHIKIKKIAKYLYNTNRKIVAREYFIPFLSKSDRNNATNLLLDTLEKRDGIYDFYFDDSAKEGISESYFCHFLESHFASPWRILKHCKFDSKKYQPTADIILIYDDLKLAVDIEIDEPYQLKNKDPIHYIENGWYEMRDKIFIDLGYIVIRFAEYQVVKYPDYCCRYIAEILNQFLGELKIALPDLDDSLLPDTEWRVKAWNKQEAKIMAERGVRSTYLNEVELFLENDDKSENK